MPPLRQLKPRRKPNNVLSFGNFKKNPDAWHHLQSTLKYNVISPTSEDNSGSDSDSLYNFRDDLKIKVHQDRRKVVYGPHLSTYIGSGDAPAPRRFYPKSIEETQFIDDCLKSYFIFESLSSEQRREMINAMEVEKIPPGKNITRQGFHGENLYVVISGEIDVLIDGVKVSSCSRGASFGEMALLQDYPRFATCIAAAECLIAKLDRETFRVMVSANTVNHRRDTVAALRKVPFLKDLDEKLIGKVCDGMSSACFRKGQQVITKGDGGDVFYIIQEGTAIKSNIGHGDSQYCDYNLGPGDYFGARALLTGEPRWCNVITTSKCELHFMSREIFESLIGNLNQIMKHSAKKYLLMGVPIIANSEDLQPFELNDLAECLVEVVFEEGDVVKDRDSLFLIQKGKVVVSNDHGMIHTLKSGDHFGGLYLQSKEEPPEQNITVAERTTCLKLNRTNVESTIGSVDRLGRPMHPISVKLRQNIQLNDIRQIKMVGEGTFGRVWLCALNTELLKNGRDAATPYALKIMEKRTLIQHKQVKAVIWEKNIMASICHPFLSNIVATFQDEHYLYMLQHYLKGGELFNVIHREKGCGISIPAARFYSSCVLEGIIYLHQRNICFRDLKPENILIDSDGYGVLIDFGLSKVITDKTYTVCGTPEYMAPEIILLQGHGRAVDYWALGAVLYEMLVGRSPFNLDGADQTAIFRRIVRLKYSFPNSVHIVPKDARDLIFNLLNPFKTQRMGCLARGYRDIQEHAWFAALDSKQLNEKKIVPPWKPDKKPVLDSNIDNQYKPEVIPRSLSLTKEEQELFQDFGPMSVPALDLLPKRGPFVFDLQRTLACCFPFFKTKTH